MRSNGTNLNFIKALLPAKLKNLKIYGKPFQVRIVEIEWKDTIVCINRFLLLNTNKSTILNFIFMERKFVREKENQKSKQLLSMCLMATPEIDNSPNPKV